MNPKISKQINDRKGENIKKLARIFPDVIKDGMVDFEALKEELGEYEEAGEEKYELTWAGKKNAKKKAFEEVSGKTLKYIPEDGVDVCHTENVYIEGDNLEVLQLLHQNYYEAVKFIYIDPPYNTGNDFIYHDNYRMSRKLSDIGEGSTTPLGEAYTVNKDSQNRFHANWLNMMYPRLKLAKDFLSEDGVIFISIDDREQQNLKMICDEIFGNCNFLAQIIWERAYAPVNLKKHFSESHDYILCYAKNKDLVKCNGLPRSQKADNRYSNPDNDPRGVWKPGDLSVGPAIPAKVYEITTPNGRKVMPPSGYCWRLDKEKFEEYVKDNRIWFGSDGGNVPSIKRFLSEVKQGITPMTIWKYREVGHSQDATKGLKKLFGGKAYFDYPKPVDLIKRCMQLYTDDHSLILDFFSGSATTAHAAMQLNAETNGKRKYILVQLPEETNRKETAYGDGYKNICEIAKERIRRAGREIRQEYPDADPDIGFKVFRVSDTNIISQMEYTPDLADFIPAAKDPDIVYELMLRQRDVALSETLELLSDIGSRTYLYAGRYLVCLETEITAELINRLAGLKPLPMKFIFRDSAFRDDIALKDETFRRFKILIEKNAGNCKTAYTVEFI